MFSKRNDYNHLSFWKWQKIQIPYIFLCSLYKFSTRGLNSLRPRLNRRHFADDIFKRIFFNESIWISINISLKSVPRCPIDNIPALVQIMAWRRPGDKALSEPMMVRLPTHICVTRPQWVNYTSTVPSSTCISSAAGMASGLAALVSVVMPPTGRINKFVLIWGSTVKSQYHLWQLCYSC